MTVFEGPHGLPPRLPGQLSHGVGQLFVFGGESGSAEGPGQGGDRGVEGRRDDFDGHPGGRELLGQFHIDRVGLVDLVTFWGWESGRHYLSNLDRQGRMYISIGYWIISRSRMT